MLVLSGMKCASGSRGGRSPDPVAAPSFWGEKASPTSKEAPPHEAVGARLLWSQKAGGAITDLVYSKQGNAIVAATVPDPDVAGSLHSQFVSRWSPKGKLVWRMPVKASTKALAVSDDASLVVVSNYSDQIRGLDARGKERWVFEGMCRPIVLTRLKHVVCYHDDDAEPFVAFDWLNFNGVREFHHPIKQDILALKVSDDERWLALALTQGVVQVFELSEQAAPALRWETQVDGEVSDLDVTAARVAALSLRKDGKQSVRLWDSAGKILGDADVRARMTQVELAETSAEGPDRVVTYGNSLQGQHLAVFEVADKGLTEQWSRGFVQPAEYNSSVQVYRDHLVVGIEDIEASGRHSHLLSLNRGGDIRWDIPLWNEEGAYLYARGYSDGVPTLAIGTDDGILRAYRLQKP